MTNEKLVQRRLAAKRKMEYIANEVSKLFRPRYGIKWHDMSYVTGQKTSWTEYGLWVWESEAHVGVDLPMAHIITTGNYMCKMGLTPRNIWSNSERSAAKVHYKEVAARLFALLCVRDVMTR